MYKSMFFRSLEPMQPETLDTNIFSCIPAIRKRRKQTAGNSGQKTGHRRQNSRKHINHSGIIGNAIPGSANQQKPSDHDKLMTSDASCHNFQTILKICTVDFRIMPEVKKRYIIRTYTQGSGSAGPDDHGKRPD